MLSIEQLVTDSELLPPADLERAIQTAEQTGVPLTIAVTRTGLLTEAKLASFFADHFDLAYLDDQQLTSLTINHSVFNTEFLRHHNILPYLQVGEPHIAMVDPTDHAAISGASFALQQRPKLAIATETNIQAALDRALGRDDATDNAQGAFFSDLQNEDIETIRDKGSQSPAIRWVNDTISQAVDHHASDIHIEPRAKETQIRFRRDGALAESRSVDPALSKQAISRIKVMANLDIAEQRLPQDGRIRATVRGRKIDLRIATTPTIHGESVVLRLLGGNEDSYALDDLGLSAVHVASFVEATNKPNGIMLITGPTGSGKTTTLYAALRRLNTPDTKILTVEDPIEYLIEGVNQVQVKPEIGLTYATTLRSFLRQDPDVMMVGEIRDQDTADIAIRAALTGHLVLSTLHTNTAIGAITRLVDMGLQRFLIASTLRLTSAQRLVRQLCPQCKSLRAIRSSEVDVFHAEGIVPPDTIFDPVGCDACNNSGHTGRLPIMETIPIGAELEAMIADGASEQDLQTTAASLGYATLMQDGLSRVASGEISLAELERVLR